MADGWAGTGADRDEHPVPVTLREPVKHEEDGGHHGRERADRPATRSGAGEDKDNGHPAPARPYPLPLSRPLQSSGTP